MLLKVFAGVLVISINHGSSFKVKNLEAEKLIKKCVAEGIDKILHKNLSFVYFFDGHPKYLPDDLTNSRVIVNVAQPIISDYGSYGNNFIIETQSNHQLHRILLTLRNVLNFPETYRGRFLIITSEQHLSETFRLLWDHYIIHIAVIYYNYNITTVFTSNPFDDQNGCGKSPKMFHSQQCDSRLSVKFPRYIRNYAKCPLFVGMTNRSLSMRYLFTNVLYSVYNSIGNILNVTGFRFYVTRSSDVFEQFNKHDIVMMEHKVIFQSWFTTYFDITWPFHSQTWVWIGHNPDLQSALLTYFLPFKITLWLIVIAVVVVVSGVWCLILYKTKTKQKFLSVFLDVTSLQLGVSITIIPHNYILKLLLFFYFVYVLHIQTAYTSNLTNILLLPKYDEPISSLQELEDSEIKIYMREVVYNQCFKPLNNISQLNKKIVVIKTRNEQIKILNNLNSKYFWFLHREEVVIYKNDMSIMPLFIKNKIPNFFIDNSQRLCNRHVFIVRKGSYFLASLNYMILILYESGLYDKIERDMYNNLNNETTVNKTGYSRVALPDFNSALTLAEVSGSFFVLGVGLACAIVVLVVECLYNRVYNYVFKITNATS